ncbi:MAG: hypothetical protein E4H14_15400 [Candidatus Thorarchaeota archaeon]|nr:MAG: hypothetical protein E4H14_15400 [Candidatus Thorarchaeota archaeon]
MYDAWIKKTEVPNRLQLLELNISIRRVMTGSAIKLMAALGGTAVLLYAVSLLPGLLLFALPGMIALVGKVYDEAKLIQFLRYGDPIRTEHWEDTETYTERIRISSFENHRIGSNF